MEIYVILTIVLTTFGILFIQKMHQSGLFNFMDDNSQKKAYREASFAEIIKINDESARHGSLDPITGLPDRHMFDVRLENTLAHSKQHNQLFGLMMLNVDEFDNINRTYGHIFGNNLLAQVANRLRTELRQIDTVSRYSGDTFYFILPELSNSEVAMLVAQRVQDSILQPFTINSNRIFVTASIGIAIYAPESDSADSLLHNAEDALTKAKLSGRNTYRIYNQLAYSHDRKELSLNTFFHSPSYIDRLVLHYQPYFDVYNHTNRIIKTSLHFNHPEIGLVPYEDFRSAVDENDKNRELALWQLNTVIEQLKKWETSGFKPDNILVNVPVDLLIDNTFVDAAATILNSNPNEKSRIIFDISNPNIVSLTRSIDELIRVSKNLDVHLSISLMSLGRLHMSNLLELPISHLKIDGDLVNDIFTNLNNETLISSLITLANNTEIKVIAEGIEQEYQKNKLLKLGCSIMAGRLFAPPSHANDLLAAETKKAAMKETKED